ncbi:hypothetical protein [Candidatus Tisiphia endosymbiont of Hybos culiciformis]|uniref:hypothetical protein n=1 Tax=Candidatus Tisiphia endosymbiont of Hybos culiciformis TaxID=3139331 RepID=UPI003CCACB44
MNIQDSLKVVKKQSTSLRGVTLVATKQSRKVIRNGLPRPLRGLAMTPWIFRLFFQQLLNCPDDNQYYKNLFFTNKKLGGYY